MEAGVCFGCIWHYNCVYRAGMKTSVMVKGPSNQGINFATWSWPFCRYSHWQCNVESMTWSPTSCQISVK